VWIPCWTNLGKSETTNCRNIAKRERCDVEDGD